MLREPFFYILREWAIDDFGKALFGDVTERNLSAVVKAASDNAPIVEYCNMSVKRTATACDSFVSRL